MALRILERGDERYARMYVRAERECPICGNIGFFEPFGLYYVRPDSRCGECRSLERHRLLKLAMDNMGYFPKDFEILHFAPEKCVSMFMRNAGKKYVTADLKRRGVDYNWNIEDIDCEDGSFDVVLCSHVLEHVDDRKALKECRRVLRPGGLALFMVPICEGLDVTYEDPEIAAAGDAQRLLHFQQRDHVRLFGRDFRDRIRNAGFDLSEYVAQGKDAVRYGLVMGDRVFISRVPRVEADA